MRIGCVEAQKGGMELDTERIECGRRGRKTCASVAQLVRALASHARGPEFDPQQK